MSSNLRHLTRLRESFKSFLIFHHAIIQRELILKLFGTKNNFLTGFVSLLATSCLLVVSLFVLITFSSYKCLIYIYLYVRFGKRLQGLITGCDILSILSDGNDGSIHGLTEYFDDESPPPVNAQQFYEFLCEHIYKRMFVNEIDRKLFSTREYCRFGYYYFREMHPNSIQVEDIIKTISIKSECINTPINDEQLMHLAAQYYNSDLPAGNKFNWDVCVCLNPLIRKDSPHFAIFTRMHHTLGDGLVIYNILVNYLFQMGEEFKLYTRNLVDRCAAATKTEKRHLHTHIHHFGYRIYMEPGKACLLRDGRHHRKTMFYSQCEKPSASTYMEKMRVIRDKFPGIVTFNILMAAYSASLADYYLKYTADDLEIPEYITSTHPVQLNVERYLDIYAASHRIKMQNNVSSYMFNCPLVPKTKHGIPTSDYLIERMLELKQDIDKCFQSFDIQAAYIWANLYFGVLPYQVIRNLFDDVSCQTLTTCLPGGPTLRLFNDKRVENITFFLPRQQFATLMLAINTYERRLQLGLTADAEKIDTPKRLKEIADGVFLYLDLLYKQAQSM